MTDTTISTGTVEVRRRGRKAKLLDPELVKKIDTFVSTTQGEFKVLDVLKTIYGEKYSKSEYSKVYIYLTGKVKDGILIKENSKFRKK